MENKTCKICGKKRYANLNICFSCYRRREKAKKEEKKLKKIEKHKLTKTYQEAVCKKLMRDNDRLFQQLGRSLYDKCEVCGGEYSCLHHFIRKSQSLFLRYNLKNGIPICAKCHCLIHQAQDSTIEGLIIIHRGEEWFKEILEGKTKIVDNKLEFLKKMNISLKNANK